MNEHRHRFRRPGGAGLAASGAFASRVCLLLSYLCLLASATHAVTFTNNASLVVTSDPATSVTSTSGVFTVSCWFKLAVPSTLALSQNMTLFMDRADGNEAANYSFLVRLNASSGALEFLSKGSTSSTTNQLLDGLFVGRWYHLAVTKTSGGILTGYLDGKQVFAVGVTLGNTTGLGFAIGGFSGTSKLFYGDMIEVAIYKAALQPDVIRARMFADQRSAASLAAYYKLGYSTNSADWLHNFVTNAPAGTDPIAKVGTGNLIFEEVDQAGEQSLFDSRLNGGQTALAPLSGSFVLQDSLLTRPVPGIAFDFRIGYSSLLPSPPGDASQDPYGQRTLSSGWRHVFDSRIMPGGNDKELKMITWDGAIESWSRTNTAQPYRTVHGEYRGDIVRLPSFEVEWTTPEKLVYKFSDPTSADDLLAGRLLEIRDQKNNKMQLEWDTGEFRLNRVTDTAGGIHQFNYDASGFLANVSFGQWQMNFTYVSDRLASQSFTNTSGAYTNAGTTKRFYYTNVMGFSLLDRVVDPRGFTNIVVTYDKYRRKTRVADALNRATTIEYGVPDYRSIRATDPESKQSLTTFDRKGRVVSETDPLGNVISYTHDAAGHRTSITEPLGSTTLFAYDSRANMIARTNALGEVTRWTYHTNFNRPTAELNALGWTTHFVLENATGNLLTQYDDLGLIVTNVYATNGLLLSSKDGRGFSTYFTNDANGFLIAKRDTAGNTTRYTYNDLGWKLSEINALGDPALFSYDLNGNVVWTKDPLLREFRKTYDANGNLTSANDAKAQYTTNAYDQANQRTNMVDRTGTNTWRYFYSARGNLTNTVNPIGVGTTNFYDAANRLIQVSAPLGNTIQNFYDPNGNLTNMVDQLGRSWTRTYDRLNRVIAETDPQGDTKLTEYDAVGRVMKTTSPNGWSSVNEYEDRGRLIRWTDPQGFHWQYDYDANGNITNITDALGGHYVMGYDSRNARTNEVNQDNKEWRYAYDELGRLKQQTDPNGTTRTLDYDGGGRILSVTFNTGRVNSFAYDENNNPEVLSRAGSGPATLSQLRYDLMDRVVEYTDAFSKKTKYQYDALGRRSQLTYPDGKTLTYNYDALSRLTNQVDWAGRKLTYEYDTASRLIRRTYPNGVVQTNAFDETGQLTNLTYSVTNALPPANAINIALTYAYDRNGNKTAATEQGTLDWPLPAKRDENARYTASGRLIEREISITGSTNPQPSTINYSYDPSGNMTNAVGNGQSWTLAYDEDNRTTRISWDCGITHKDITNRYDALGRRIAKTMDGTQTGYVLDLAAGMERILCDLAPNGQITAYYIHGPDLCYKVTPGAPENLTCYHADAQANIIALTGGDGTNLAQYAYTPYGRSLGSTNLQSQISNPYLFVGSQGVMEELPGLYFMRARYYSAEAGMFLSTDPVKNIGPGWKPVAYSYAEANPVKMLDPSGTVAGEMNPLSILKYAYGGTTYLIKESRGHATDADRLKFGMSTIDLAGRVLLNELVWQGLVLSPWQASAVSISGAIGWYALPIVVMGDLTKHYYNWQGNPWKGKGISTSLITLEEPQVADSKTSQVKDKTSDANNHANNVNEQNTYNGNSGSGKGGSTVTPLSAQLSSKAGRAKSAASGYARQAGASYAEYQRQQAMYQELITSYQNTDYFNYFLAAQEPKRLADQAYSQYRYYQSMAREAMGRYSRYMSAASAAGRAGL